MEENFFFVQRIKSSDREHRDDKLSICCRVRSSDGQVELFNEVNHPKKYRCDWYIEIRIKMAREKMSKSYKKGFNQLEIRKLFNL